MKHIINGIWPCVSLALLAAWVRAEPVDYINPMIGTSSTGRMGATPPGADVPFGMVILSPDTCTGSHFTSGYDHAQKTIEGFSVNHMSGVGWFGALGNFEVMPTTGPLRFHASTNKRDLFQPGTPGWESPFSHGNEKAEAGYYRVKLDRYDIGVELTCTKRSGLFRFTFPESTAANIQIDLAREIGGRSGLQHNEVVVNGTIKGWIKCWGTGQGFASGTRYILYYYAKFSRPWESYGLWNKGIDLGALAIAENEDLGFYAKYSTRSDEPVLLKVGISYVSMEGAQANLEHENSGWDFDAVRNQARTDWSNALAGIVTTGGTEKQKTEFYTALYHAMMYPCGFTDVDGRYWGADLKIHQQKPGYTTRMGYSGWDVFRHQFPLFTLMRPDVVNDEINTFLDICQLTGKTYPLWQLMGQYTGAGFCDAGMVTVVDAYMKGIRGYDVGKAFEIAKRTATGPDTTRRFFEEINSHGYVYGDKSISVSRTLEGAYADWCLSRFAEAMGQKTDAAFYRQRAAENYKKVYDPVAGWMRWKGADGNWMVPWTNKFAKEGCKEGNTYQWTWFVPHDVQGLIDLMGKDRFISELDEFFAGAPANFGPTKYYNQANEPDMQVISYFNFTGQPWKTQYWTRKVLENGYGTDQDGLPGNDDMGEMSAWYVLNAIGLNQVASGDNVWEIGSPVFDQIVIPLDGRFHDRAVADTFTIKATNNSPENIYVQSATLNGRNLSRAWITHAEIIAGGRLELVMGPAPSTWGSKGADRPPSLSQGTFPSAINTKVKSK